MAHELAPRNFPALPRHRYRHGAGLSRLARATLCGLMLLGLGAAEFAASEVPVVKGGLGPCTADFTVTDKSQKPIYDAKIHVTIKYGFMNKRSQELEIGTNSDGRARIEGLPDKLKKNQKPLEFQIRSGQETKSVTQDPETNCHASFKEALGGP